MRVQPLEVTELACQVEHGRVSKLRDPLRARLGVDEPPLPILSLGVFPTDMEPTKLRTTVRSPSPLQLRRSEHSERKKKKKKKRGKTTLAGERDGSL